ncbi:HBL/NHE enterotoxin family protein [Pedococcus sp. 5OH_020]|uniref:HBL/NHE enterotoxin family protein n=1 Tax=Pedococcus sp. 5OH_020 TaxID=2989814 RepID=UPI0022E9BADE|nr:HBL/NHE enterotoxin family protein [Pedococcus sp. 5OH_020]
MTTTPTGSSPASGVSSGDAKQAIASGIANMHIVTAYALAVQHTEIHPATDPAPAWFDALSANLDVAKGHAQRWIDLVPELTATIPSAVIDYGSEFKAAADLILELLQQAQGLAPNSAQYKALVTKTIDYLTALRGELTTIDGALDSAGKQLDAFQAAAEADFTSLTDGVDSIQTAEAGLAVQIAKAKADIEVLNAKIASENSLLTDSLIGLGLGLLVLIAGIALAVVTFGLGVVVAVGGGLVTLAGAGTATAMGVLIKQQHEQIARDQVDLDNEGRQIVVLSALNTSVQNLRDQNTAAQQALTHIREMWTTFDKTLEHIVDLVGKAEDPLNTVLDELWVRSAVEEWTTLVEFATALEGMAVTQQNQGMVPLPAVS